MTPNEMIEQCVPMVKSIAGKMIKGTPGNIEMEDLMSIGNLALVEAAYTYDKEKALFSTHANWEIQFAIGTYLRKEDHLSRFGRVSYKKISSAKARLATKTGRLPDSKEIAKEMNISLKKYFSMYNHTCHPKTKESLNINFMYNLNRTELRQVIAYIINTLTEQQKIIIILYYYDEAKVNEIGVVIGVTGSRISHIHMQAKAEIKKKFTRLVINES